MRSALSLVFFAAGLVLAQPDGPCPAPNKDAHDTSEPRLTGKRFKFDQLPFQADTSGPQEGVNFRGAQFGYNNCTGRPSSDDANCQTLVMNNIDDFCLFAPPELSPVGNAESRTVAYCTKPTHGARLIPAGALSGVQWLRAPSYVAITGFIDQTKLNIPSGDYGGELDSGGQDMRGNAIGALAYSNSLPFSLGQMTQSVVWHQFIGGNMFCAKLCDNKSANPRGLCRHTLDTLGCGTNVPAQYAPNVFLSCQSDDQAPVQSGVTQPPASSSCTTYQSAQLYGANATPIPAPTVSPTGGSQTITTTSSTSLATGSPSSSSTPGGSQTRPTTSTGPGGANPSGTAPPGGSAASVGASALSLVIAGLFGFAVLA